MTPRLTLALAGVAALLLAAPPPGLPTVLLLLLGAAGLVRALLRPGALGPLLVIAVAVVEQAVAGPPGWSRLVLLALALATVHAAAALAAVTPRGAGVQRAVLLRWTARVLATTAVGLAAVALTAVLPAPPPVAATVTGLAAVLALLAGLLAGTVWVQLRQGPRAAPARRGRRR